MIFHVNTCTGEHALGSPTAIVYDENFSTEECLRITRAFGYSETGFFKKSGGLRFFAATGELPFCGHTLLGAAHVHFQRTGISRMEFYTKIGTICITRMGEGYSFALPKQDYQEIPLPPSFKEIANRAYLGRDLFLLAEDVDAMKQYIPNKETLLAQDGLLVHLASLSEEYDYEYRTFGPKVEVFEDEACVSAHGMLAPFFSAQLGKTNLKAHQRSPRGGDFWVDTSKKQVKIYAKAEIFNIEYVYK